jgi:hypothetical protein
VRKFGKLSQEVVVRKNETCTDPVRMRRENTFVPAEVKNYIHSGVEKRYLGRLITSRPRFDSGPRNKYYRTGLVPVL